MPREYLVIQDSRCQGVFATDEMRAPKGYIPRDVAESLLGRDLSGPQWFTEKQSAAMRTHPEWLDKWPETTGDSDRG